MVRLTIKTDGIGCRKPGCKHRLDIPHRHHRRYESLFITFFGRHRRNKSEKYEALRKRYEEFRPEDTVVLCGWHHAEIHKIYNQIVREDCAQRLKPLDRYSWKQAHSLMNKLHDACTEWEIERTPGVNPSEVFKDKPKSNATYV